MWSKLDLNSRPLVRVRWENCPRIRRGIRTKIKAALLERILSHRIRLASLNHFGWHRHEMAVGSDSNERTFNSSDSVSVRSAFSLSELPPCVNESSPHHSFSPVAFGQLHSDGVQFPNAMLTWARTGWRSATLPNLKSFSDDATTPERHSVRSRR